MDRVIVDTNILVDYSKGKLDILQQLFDRQESGGVDIFVNPVIIAEFFADEELLTTKKKQKAKSFINLFKTLNITYKVGIKAGEILRKKQTEHIADALIAASCLEGKLQLVTRNKKHFRKVKGLKIYKV